MTSIADLGQLVDFTQTSLYCKMPLLSRASLNHQQLLTATVSALAIIFNPTFWKYVP